MCIFNSVMNFKNTAELPVNIQIAKCRSNEYCHPVGKYEEEAYKRILGQVIHLKEISPFKKSIQ